jgi:hypothetical protein
MLPIKNYSEAQRSTQAFIHNEVPKEILVLFFKYVPKDLDALRLTCKKFNEVIIGTSILKQMYYKNQMLTLAKETALGIGGAYLAATYRVIAEDQANAGDIEGAKETAAGIEDANHRASAYRAIVEAQAKAGDIEGAKKTAAGIENTPHRASAYGLIAKAQAKAGDIEGAKKTAAGIEDGYNRVNAYMKIYSQI